MSSGAGAAPRWYALWKASTAWRAYNTPRSASCSTPSMTKYASITSGKCSSQCGTPLYMAPEMFTGAYGVEADVWACAVIYFIMLSGILPFFAECRKDMIKIVQNCEVELEFFKDDFEGVSKDAKDLIRRILVADPTRRPSITSVIEQDVLMQRVQRADMLAAATKGTPWVPLDSRRWPAHTIARLLTTNVTSAHELHKCISPTTTPVSSPQGSVDHEQSACGA